jgi:nucleoside-specific outer membrane channel protein Tsx
MEKSRIHTAALAALLLAGSGAASAADWSDTSLSYRYGQDFHEPFVLNADGSAKNISKNIYTLQHADGYKYGTNFFNVDLLQSSSADPAVSGGGAQEAYVVYRNTFDLAKISGKDMKFGVVRDIGITAGFDWNTKNDVGYSSKKRMVVLGPDLSWDVPGFLDTRLLALWESNDPTGITSRYEYKTHPALETVWGIPIGSLPLSFGGYLEIIAPKGHDEFGNSTKTETNFDGKLMLDVGAVAGMVKDTFKLGFEYQYWKNKFGNTTSGDAGALAKTPMIRAEYHF